MLGRSIQSLSYGGSDSPAEIRFADDESYTVDCVLTVEKEMSNHTRTKLLRAIIILAKPILLAHPLVDPAQEDGSEEQEASQYDNALFVIPPGRLLDGQPANPITVLMSGEGSFSAPAGQCEFKRLAYGHCAETDSDIPVRHTLHVKSL